MIVQSQAALHLLRNLVIAVIIALTITLAPVVRADTVKFIQNVFGGSRQAAVVRANLTH